MNNIDLYFLHAFVILPERISTFQKKKEIDFYTQ